MLRAVGARLDSAVFKPATLPADVVLGLALVPPTVAGLLLFRLHALEMLGISLGVGAALHAIARLARQPMGMSPVLPAVIATGLLGPVALQWAAAVAGAAAFLELVRARLLPGLRAQTAFLAWAALFLAVHGRVQAYVAPLSLRPLAEPIHLWQSYFAAGAQPVDPIRLYVGNVPGPIFATSLMAVAVGGAWLWYARRLAVTALVGFAAGSLLPILYFHWNAAFQLDSGPTWLAAFLLADRRMLPSFRPARPLVGFAAGVAALGARHYGLAV
ncbi:MAG: RnfABCDGE type electron transport complex subunit D, partial [Candidatus Dormibacterales bacterium]